MRAMMSFLLGCILIGTILIGFVAAENFFVIDRILESPNPAEFHQKLAPLAEDDARIVLRFLSSELNRLYFRAWGGGEILLSGVLLILAMRSGPNGSKDRKLTIGAGVLLAMSLFMTFYLATQLVEVGRAIDFVPRDPVPPEVRQFGMLHGAYSVLDLGKLAVGIWMTVLLARSPASTPRA